MRHGKSGQTTLSQKALTAIIGVGAAMVLLVNLGFWAFERSQVNDLFANAFSRILESFAQPLAYAVWITDTRQIGLALDAIASQPFVAQIEIFDGDQVVWKRGSPAADSITFDRNLLLRGLGSEASSGRLVISFDRAAWNRELANETLKRMAMTLVAGALVLLVLFFVLDFLLTRRVVHLAKQVAAIDLSNSEALAAAQPPRSSAARPDEIDLLTDAVGAMISRTQSALEEVHTNERRFRAIAQRAQDAFVTVNQSGRIVFWNAAAARIFGYSIEEALDQPLTIIIPDSFWPDHADGFERFIQQGDPDDIMKRAELTARSKAGGMIPIEITLSAWDAPDGRFVNAVIRDIRQRLQDEAQARRLTRAIEQSPSAVIITDPDGTIEFVNPKFTEVTGYTAEEAIGNTPRLLKSDTTPMASYEDLWATILAGEDWRGELLNRRKDGSTYWASASISPVLGPDGQISNFIGIQQDITERKLTEDRLQRSQKMEAVGLLAGGIAHDFNNILAGIQGHATLIRDDAEKGSETFEDAESIRRAVNRARAMVAQLLAFSRRSDNETRSAVSLVKIIEEVELLVRASVPSNIVIKIATDNCKQLVKAVPHQIHQVLINLVTNAADAIGDRSGRIRIGLDDVVLDGSNGQSLSVQKPGDYVRLSVHDTGPGMPPEVIENIYLPFFTTKEVGKGTGLGLALVHGIIEDHGGTIQVKCPPGEGTTFEIYLPAVSDDTATACPGKTETIRHDGSGQRILVVDDEPNVASPLARLLTRRGFEVEICLSGSEALARLQSGTKPMFDAVITDLVMPEMMGDELAGKIQAQFPALPILLSTGRGGDYQSDQAKLRNGGFSGFVAKPYDIEEVIISLKSIIGGAD